MLFNSEDPLKPPIFDTYGDPETPAPEMTEDEADLLARCYGFSAPDDADPKNYRPEYYILKFGEIVRETPKAFVVTLEVMLPKSQVKLRKRDKTVLIPGWLNLTRNARKGYTAYEKERAMPKTVKHGNE